MLNKGIFLEITDPFTPNLQGEKKFSLYVAEVKNKAITFLRFPNICPVAELPTSRHFSWCETLSLHVFLCLSSTPQRSSLIDCVAVLQQAVSNDSLKTSLSLLPALLSLYFSLSCSQCLSCSGCSSGSSSAAN